MPSLGKEAEMPAMQNIRVLDQDFPDELEAWEHNKEEWSKGNMGKYLIIRGGELVDVLETAEEMRDYQEKYLLEAPALIRLVMQESFLENFASYSGPAPHA